MAAPVALIQGASRGLGLEFCRHILRNKTPAAVIATCRNPDGAAELRGLAGQHPGRLTVLQLDVNREEDIRGAADRVKESFGRLDLIVNSSAMLHPSGKGETSLRDVSAQGIISTLTTNTVGPLVMAKYFAPLLQKGGGSFGQQPAEKAKQHSGIIVNITAKVGSIGDNGLGGWYSYRMSKAALNMATRNLSIELGRSRPKVGGVCVLTSRNSQHRPLPAVSQERAKRQAVQCRTLCDLSDEHHRLSEYGKDWQGIQLGWD
uniref:C-factor isoform X1 n=1 Tax=Epinephelus lanceolatus TaxID=310571 RepID=UPI00144712BB|nr:C-factor isoform X1 [Epinephelus lanceolatus]